MQLLLEKDADVNTVDQMEGWTALMFAAAEGHAQVVRTLLSHGADATVQDVDGDTARSFAVQNGYAEVIRALKDGS